MYTNYWRRTDEPFTKEFVNDVLAIIASCFQKRIRICGGNGEGIPEINENTIWFNGCKEFETSYDSFMLTSNPEDAVFSFCKTGRMPYDYAVKEVLESALRHNIISRWSADGDCEQQTDYEYVSDNCDYNISKVNAYYGDDDVTSLF
jgi:hypothetical protein